MSHRTLRFVHPARAALAAIPVLAVAACSGGTGTGPGGTLASARTTARVVGTWAYAAHDTSSAPMLGTRIIGDTLTLRADESGTWAITTLDPLDERRHQRTVITLRWQVDGESLRVIPTCTPVELCDPLPPWVGRFGTADDVFLLPGFPSLEPPARRYMRVER